MIMWSPILQRMDDLM